MKFHEPLIVFVGLKSPVECGKSINRLSVEMGVRKISLKSVIGLEPLKSNNSKENPHIG